MPTPIMQILRANPTMRITWGQVVVAAMLAFFAPAVTGQDAVEGLTEPYQQIELAAGEPGILAQIAVREGARVNAGETIAELDVLVLERTLAIARHRAASTGAIDAAVAELDLREKMVQQLSILEDRGNATQRELDRARTDVVIAQSRLALAREEQELQRLECERIEAQIERRKIRSPIDGIVSEVFREAGESFLSNDPRVATIVEIARLRARFSALPGVAKSLRVGETIKMEFTEEGKIVEGVVESIAPLIDPRSNTQMITAVIENRDEQITSGARCLLLVDPRLLEQNSTTETRMTSRKNLAPTSRP